MAFVGPNNMPKILGKIHQSTTKRATNKTANVLATCLTNKMTSWRRKNQAFLFTFFKAVDLDNAFYV